jgi:cytochrome c oxidase subunit 2
MFAIPALLMNVISTAAVAPFGTHEFTGFGMPKQASTVAAEIDNVYNFITILSIFFFVIIVGAMLLFIMLYRRGREDGTQRIAEKTSTHNTPLEVTWTVIPLILAIAMFYVGMRGYLDLRQPPADAYTIDVTAKKWNWEFNYIDEVGQITLPDELVVPVNRPVKLNMMSMDVLHSCFIPAFRVKQDVVPGRYTYLWFTATEVGTYTLFCAEYCGTNHSNMIATVHVVPEDEFKAILAEKGNWIKNYSDEKLEWAGLRLYNTRGCTQCHSLDGSKLIGPSLKDTHDLWGENRVFTDGSEVTVDENYILDSLRNPQGNVVMNFTGAMPAQNLKLREMIAIARFIKMLNTVTDENGAVLPEPSDVQTIEEEAAE